MLLRSTSAATRKRSISTCDSCFEGLVLAIGDLRQRGSPQREDYIPDADRDGKPVLRFETGNEL